jgi:POT family proton-dependent oligopeptide transporter
MSEVTTVEARHPKGLYLLFATEMWERFNFYGMRALLVLFLVNALRFSDADSAKMYGGFLGLCYLTPILGGFISDRFLGNRLCIMLGGTIMGIGQLMLFLSASLYDSTLDTSRLIMWIALGTLIMGNGLFKPNISSMVGQLYPKGDKRLDSAFTIFYMGINLGAFLGMTICALAGDVKIDDVRVVTAFKWGFLAAAIAMFLSVIIFYIFKDKYLLSPEGVQVGTKPSQSSGLPGDEATHAKFENQSILAAIGISIVLFFFFNLVAGQNYIYSFIFSSGAALASLILMDKSLTKVEKDRIMTLYIIAFFVMFFWACFEQAGSSLTFVADYQTDTNIFGWDMPPSLVQNANSFFIIVLAPLFSILWLWLAQRNREPISPVKQAMGLGLLSLGFLLMATRVNGMGLNEKMGVMWLVGMYFLHTVGELFLSPVGLSLVSKLAPMRFSSLLMGVWFLANAGGYALAGTLGALLPPTGDKFKKATELNLDLQGILDGKVQATAEQLAVMKENNIPDVYPSFVGFEIHNLYDFFMVFIALPGGAAIILFLLSGKLKKMMHGIK